MKMRAYTFGLTGASPHNGIIVVICKSINSATGRAEQEVEEYNEHTKNSNIKLTGEMFSETLEEEGPTVVYFESGEA